MPFPRYTPSSYWKRLVPLLLLLPALLLASVNAHAQESHPAHSADAFVESVGMNIHLGYTDTKYYNDFATIADKLDALGIRYVRSSIADPAGWKDPLMLDLYDQTGIQMVAVVSEREGGWPHPLDLRPAAMDSLLDVAEEHYVNDERQVIAAFEGPNEYDISHGPEEDDWVGTLRSYQQMLYDKVNARPSLQDIPVLAPSIAFHPDEAGDFSGMADRANMHPYPGGNEPSSGLSQNMDTFGNAVEGAPIEATETGYHNALGDAEDGEGYLSQPGVPESVEAKYLPRLFAEYFRRGVARTFSYELLDLFPDEQGDHQEHNFGLLRNDLSEKPAFGALQNTIALLEDPGPSFDPGTLAYGLAGETENVRSVLLQKRDGRFFLVLWQEVPGYEIPEGWKGGAEGTVLDPAPAGITLHLGTPIEEARVYRPLTGGTAPTATYVPAPQTLSLDVPDHLLVVELEPGGDSPETGDGTGLKADFFEGPSIAGVPTATRIDAQIDFDFGSGAPIEALPNDGYAVRWSGQVEPQVSGAHTFRTLSDDGLRLWVDGEQIVDAWRDGGHIVGDGTIDLEAGQKYDIRLEYYENGGLANVQLKWIHPQRPLGEVIPQSQLSPSSNADESGNGSGRDGFRSRGTGLAAAFFEGRSFYDPVATRTDAEVSFDFGSGAPTDALPHDQYAARWTGQVEPTTSGTHVLKVVSDDGARLWLDGEKVIDAWYNGAHVQGEAAVELTAGQRYDLRLEYYEGGGDAHVKLMWDHEQLARGPEVIPQRQLYPSGSAGTPEGEAAMYESEDATLTNSVVNTNHDGHSGTGFVNFGTRSGAEIVFAVKAEEAGPHRLAFDYALSGTARTVGLRVNGEAIGNEGIRFAGTGGWASWLKRRATVALNEGANTVALVTIGEEGPNLDRLTVIPAGDAAVVLQAGGAQQQRVASRPAREAPGLPEAFALEASYPNPFHERTTLRYALPRTAQVHIEVYDALGRQVRTLADARHREAGHHRVRFEARDLSSGIYFAHLVAEEPGGQRHVQTRKLVLVR